MTSSNPLPIVERSSSVAKPERWLSVDVLRGLTIGFMILVNNNGDEQHAAIMGGERVANASRDLRGEADHRQMVRIDPGRHALCHPDERAFLNRR